MNKVFKVIWNHATQSWVAVSELTSAKGKTKSKKLTALSVAVGSALVGTPALAAVYVNNQQVAAAGVVLLFQLERATQLLTKLIQQRPQNTIILFALVMLLTQLLVTEIF